MPSFTTILQKFGEKGDKTRWTYIEIPIAVTDELKPGQKTSFRVKGTLDEYPIRQIALLPLGRSVERITDGLEGGFMMPINAAMRRGIGKQEEGETIRITLDVDDEPLAQSADLLACLDDDPSAKQQFASLPKSHQQYFSNWIEEAKTPETKNHSPCPGLTWSCDGYGFWRHDPVCQKATVICNWVIEVIG